MKFDPQKHHRHAMRLKGFDYSSQGAYAVTICYRLVEMAWNALPNHFSTVSLDTIAIVPDHVHCIVWLNPTEEKKPTLGYVVRAFKGDFSRAWTQYVMENEGVKPDKIWQERFYDHIIRDQCDLQIQRRYILENPEKHRLQDEGYA